MGQFLPVLLAAIPILPCFIFLARPYHPSYVILYSVQIPEKSKLLNLSTNNKHPPPYYNKWQIVKSYNFPQIINHKWKKSLPAYTKRLCCSWSHPPAYCLLPTVQLFFCSIVLLFTSLTAYCILPIANCLLPIAYCLPPKQFHIAHPLWHSYISFAAIPLL